MPTLQATPRQTTEAEYSSDDEAPAVATEEHHCPQKDDDAVSKRHNATRGDGYIYTTLKAAKDKQAPKHHVAVDWDSIPEHVQGCRKKERRTNVNVQGKMWHVLCDTKLRSPIWKETHKELVTAGYQLCNICASRRRRWRMADARANTK